MVRLIVSENVKFRLINLINQQLLCNNLTQTNVGARFSEITGN